MGYPLPQYRPTSGSMDRGGFQNPRPKSGDILRFPSAVSDARKRRELQRERKGKQAPRVKKHAPANNAMRAAKMRSARRDLTGYAQRLALRNQALRGLKTGFRFRAMLFRSVASWLLGTLIVPALQQAMQRPGALSKHPGWTVSGRWGTYPYCSGQTAAHTTGATIDHNNPPTVFGHPWSGAPFDWAEYDSVDRLQNPVTMAFFWRFVQVGRGDQGTGINPTTYYNGIKNLPQPFDYYPSPMKNPWGLPYNPSWNKQHGLWPEGFPQPDALPLPSGLDDFSLPIYGPTPMPQPMPYSAIPGLVPNPYRAPSEQSQRGPHRVRAPRQQPRPDFDPFGWQWPDLVNWPRPRDEPDPPPVNPPKPRPPTVTTFTPGNRPSTRTQFRKRGKPGRRTKERKFKATQAAARFLLGIVNNITEMSDFVRALHKALPKKYQRRGKLIKDQWADVYRHWDEIDILHAIRSVARDQLEDMIYGKLGRISGKAANKRGGLYDPAGRAMRKLQGATYDPDNPDPIKLLLDRMFGTDT